MTREMINRLEELVSPVQLPADMQQYLLDAAIPEYFRPGQYLLRRGEICQRAVFLVKGLVRSFYMHKGKEVTSGLLEKGFVISSWTSFYTQHTAPEYIVAMEDCHTVTLHYSDIQHLYRNFPVFNELNRKQAAYFLYHAELRTQLLRGISAAERYEQFCEMHPGLLLRVPLKYIASYLGMTDVTLSRLRASYKSKLVS